MITLMIKHAAEHLARAPPSLVVGLHNAPALLAGYAGEPRDDARPHHRQVLDGISHARRGIRRRAQADALQVLLFAVRHVVEMLANGALLSGT